MVGVRAMCSPFPAPAGDNGTQVGDASDDRCHGILSRAIDQRLLPKRAALFN